MTSVCSRVIFVAEVFWKVRLLEDVVALVWLVRNLVLFLRINESSESMLPRCFVS